jgi:phosphoribosyl-ATP pyrophosphohydrolase
MKNKLTYLWSNGMVDGIAKKVAEEPMENISAIDEERSDEIRRRRKELDQMEMYDDPYMNWSGHR